MEDGCGCIYSLLSLHWNALLLVAWSLCIINLTYATRYTNWSFIAVGSQPEQNRVNVLGVWQSILPYSYEYYLLDDNNIIDHFVM